MDLVGGPWLMSTNPELMAEPWLLEAITLYSPETGKENFATQRFSLG